MIRRTALTVVGGALVLTLAACGSSGGSSGGGAGSASQAPSPAGNAARGPAASGTIASVAASSIEVQNPSSGQVTVNFSGDTRFTQRVAATLADVAKGSCAVVAGTGQPITAKTVEISPATGNGCGFGGGARSQGTRAPRPSGTNRNNTGSGQARTAGTVTAVSATGFTVHEDNPQTGAGNDIAVTVDSSTTFTRTESATASALKVGECATADGQTDDTGTVTARTIGISQPGPDGCVTGGTRQRTGGTNG
ncbi:DUF5666 domain-containing protein [Amycolatopsis thermophila]|uniref:DUF5666 domain-containing protein n=1 Tax=Amycolatopsis thermophila TaxID=206084 RepID=A0ABU0F6H8_9PSEU|nr:DUF5666 domain-containing protein [Amycolatopsis thermophila]MDQ0382929.1 hypothetical protein [Amycolatopsis thermophila]